MAKSLEFGRSVLVMDADDAKLEATLKADEQLVSQSVNKMQGSANKLTVGTATMGAAVGVLGASVAAFGAAAGASGNATLQALAPIGGFVAAVGTMSVAVALAKAELLGLIVTTKAYAVANVAATAALAPLVAAIVAVRVIKGRAAQKELDELRELEAASNRSIMRLGTELKHRQSIAAITDKIAVAEGRLSKEEARLNELRRAAPGLALSQLEERVAAETELAATLAANAAAKEQERLAIAETTRKETELLGIETERLRIAEEKARAAAAEARALSAKAGPQTPGEARALISEELALETARQRGIFNLLKALEGARPGGQRAETIEELLRRFGFGAGGPTGGGGTTTRFGPGAIELSAFAATGRGGAGITGPDAVQAERLAKERKRTEDVGKIATAVAELTGVLRNANRGAR